MTTFPIVNFPLISSNIPASLAYGVYISELTVYMTHASIQFDSVDHTLIMIEEQLAIEIIEDRINVQNSHKKWREQLQTTISKFRSISSDIQDLEKNIKKSKLLCSSVGFASGVMAVAGLLGAPLTFGGSLSLTALGTGIGFFSGATNMILDWNNSSQIDSKCNEAKELLEENQKLTQGLIKQTVELHKKQTTLCTPFSTLGGIACTNGDALVALMARNFPNIEIISWTLGPSITSFKTVSWASCTFRTGGKTVTPMVAKVGKMASKVAKNSVRVMGVAALGYGLLTDVVNIVDGLKTLDQGDLSQLVTEFEDIIDKMENEMKRFDKVLLPRRSSAQNPLIKKT